MKDRRLKMEGNLEIDVPSDEQPLIYTDPFHGNNFLKKLYQLYLQEDLCDVKLCVENNRINAHKTVLAANSPYFEGRY